jgi:spermidine synthase
MSLRKIISLSMILTGATAMAGQIIFLREFLVVFYGNEISIGIVLASWLMWVAIGSIVAGRFSDRLARRIRFFSCCQIALALALPVTLLFIRISKNILGVTTGEIIGYIPMILSSFLILMAPCVLIGFMFSLACRIYRDTGDNPAKSIARIYVMEATGALFGGLLVSYVLIRFLPPFHMIFILFSVNILASLLMQGHLENTRIRSTFQRVTLALIILSILILFFGGGETLRQFSLRRLWTGFNVLASKDTVYGNITVTERGGQLSFFENGLHLYTVPDVLSAEETVHYALLQSSDPVNVLLVGGGAGGAIEEILKHPVKKVDYVELDPSIIKMARKYLPEKYIKHLDDPRVNMINEDGRFFVKRTLNKYDCVIINIGDPYTAQINRFYTVDFFSELSGILTDGGVAAFSLTSSENYIGEELRDYLVSVFMSAKKVFSQVIVIPGDTAHFIASKDPGVLAENSEDLVLRIQKRALNTRYVNDYYLFDRLSPDRIEYVREVFVGGKNVEENRDFKPISFYYATAFWGTHFDLPIVRKLMRSVSSENIWLITVMFCFSVLFFCGFWGKRRKKRAVLLAVMTTGFAEINFQIAVILSFQVIYGYVFYKMGIIITSFMVGLAAGGWLISILMSRLRDDMKIFIWTQISICIYPLILPVVFFWLSNTRSEILSWGGANIIFPILPAIAGFIGGFQFPLAGKICLKDESGCGNVAGLSYGLDLFGACFGSLLAAAFLVPILGILGTCILVAVVNITVLSVLIVYRR